MIEFTEFDEVINFQFCASGFNVIVSLLRFLKHLSNLGLRVVVIFPDISYPCSVIQAASPPPRSVIILTNSIFEY